MEYRGFYWAKDRQAYRVRVQHRKKRYLVGDYVDPIVAHLAYLTEKEELVANQPPDPPSGKDQKRRLAEEQARAQVLPPHIRLEAELRKLHLWEMADAAKEGYYGDFTSPLAMPITQLVSDLAKVNTDEALALRQRAMDGEFDG